MKDICKKCNQIQENCEICSINFDTCQTCADGYTLVYDAALRKSVCKSCQIQYPGCSLCSRTSSKCEKCGTDASSNQLYLLLEGTDTSCISCIENQQKKEIVGGISEL